MRPRAGHRHPAHALRLTAAAVQPGLPQLLRVLGEATRAAGSHFQPQPRWGGPGRARRRNPVHLASPSHFWAAGTFEPRFAGQSGVIRGGSAQCHGGWQWPRMCMSPSEPLQRALHDLRPSSIFNCHASSESDNRPREAVSKRSRLRTSFWTRAPRAARAGWAPPGLTAFPQTRRATGSFCIRTPPPRASSLASRVPLPRDLDGCSRHRVSRRRHEARGASWSRGNAEGSPAPARPAASRVAPQSAAGEPPRGTSRGAPASPYVGSGPDATTVPAGSSAFSSVLLAPHPRLSCTWGAFPVHRPHAAGAAASFGPRELTWPPGARVSTEGGVCS